TRVEKTLADDAPVMVQARLALGRGALDAMVGEATSAIEQANRVRALVDPGLDSSVDGILDHILLRCYVYVDDLDSARAVYGRIRTEPDDRADVDRAVRTGAFSQAELEA